MYTFQNANQALIGMSKELLSHGQWRDVRGFRCLEIPHPVMIEITNPADRYITIPQRRWNAYLPFVESLWMALGLNDLDVLPGHYVKNLYKYSDNGRTWRAGYGPRIRAFRGTDTDYDISDVYERHIYSGQTKVVDQLAYVLDAFKRDPFTRQAVIQIGDPVKDCYGADGQLLETKDYPCSRVIQFMRGSGGALNCTLYIRSNDILFGMSAVNMFNFTWMQEYLAGMLGLQLGQYYHVANNLHVYEEHLAKIECFAACDLDDYASPYTFDYLSRDNEWSTVKIIKQFDAKIEELYRYEQLVRYDYVCTAPHYTHAMFTDWAKVFLHHADQRNNCQFDFKFINPYLNELFK